ncbi:hypothetical protein QYK82_004878, partial [Salmonella enterica]|nr:hypothetical protein [Salmonella enterica]
MNKIFKVIYSKELGRPVVVSELSKSNSRLISSALKSPAEPALYKNAGWLRYSIISSLILGALSALPMKAVANVFLGDGKGAEGNTVFSIAIGEEYQGLGATKGSTFSIAIGTSAQATQENAIALGNVTRAENNGSIAIGNRSVNKSKDSLALGLETKVDNKSKYSTVIGEHAIAENAENSIVLGSKAKVSSVDSIVMGSKATISKNAENSISLGSDSNVSAKRGVAIGRGSSVSVEDGVAIGTDSFANTQAGQTPYVISKATEEDKKRVLATRGTGGGISFGRNEAAGGKTIYRQLTNVAAGFYDTDAVNVSQLKAVESLISKDGNYETLLVGSKEGGHLFTDGKNGLSLTAENGDKLDLTASGIVAHDAKGNPIEARLVTMGADAGETKTGAKFAIRGGKDARFADSQAGFSGENVATFIDPDGNVSVGIASAPRFDKISVEQGGVIS